MKGKTARAISLEILLEVEESDRPLDLLLTEAFKRYRHLTPLDRSFLTELTYGVLRWRQKCDWLIKRFSNVPFHHLDSRILNILRLGFYQILFLSKIPVSAAVNESVNLAKRIRGAKGAGFVNAILRSFLRNRDKISFSDLEKTPDIYISINYSHPIWLIERWLNEMGEEETKRLCEFNNTIPPLTLRVNTLKIEREMLIEKLRSKGLAPFPTQFSDEGIYLLEPPPVSELPFLKEGFYIIQDEASQIVTAIMAPKPGEKILDACASPGGKTTHIAQMMENRGEIYAIDINQTKINIIKKMCKLLGVDIVKSLKADATMPLPFPKEIRFDRILADVPCSGFGTLRRNPDLKWKRGEEDIKRLGGLQFSILNNLSNYVKEGGVLVYSTCTIFREENEEVIEKFLSIHREFKLEDIRNIVPERLKIFIKDGYFKTFPPKDQMDGFFVARLLKD